MLSLVGVAGCSNHHEPAPLLAQAPKKQAPAGGQDKLLPEDAARKIIYTGTIHLTVGDFAASEKALVELVAVHKGYLAGSEVRGNPGSPRHGSWTIRVPVERFDAFHKAVLPLGELERAYVDSRDVTEEYHDVEARIKNKKTEEARLLHHLEKTAGKLDEILALEKEISRVRGEIERDQGKQLLLSKLAALATLTVHLQERSRFAPAENAGFGTSIGRTFGGSWSSLVALGESLVLAVVAVIPWLIPLALLLPVGIFARKRLGWGRRG